MSFKIIEKIMSNLDRTIKEEDLGNPYFKDKRYNTIPIEAKNFKRIELEDVDLKIGFIDGGNQEIIGAPIFSIQANRVYHSIFKGQQRLGQNSLSNRIEFFTVSTSEMKKSGIFYNTAVFPMKNEHQTFLPNETDLSFNSLDKTLRFGQQRAEIANVAAMGRRFAEWSYAVHVVNKELKEKDVIVLDKTLQTAYTNESKYSNKLYDSALKKKVIVTGLSKSSRLYTDTGLSLIGAIKKFSEDNVKFKSWYVPIAEITMTDHDAVIFIVKLHPNADYVFRFEICRKHYSELSEDDLHKIFLQLAKNSCDISFPGYPYGLIDADNFARVNEADVESYKYMIFSRLAKNGKWDKFARHIRAIDAHDILNKLIR